jgi:hypothetical protein
MEFCIGLKEIRIHCRKCISRAVTVALSAQPPGVNNLCVCTVVVEIGFFFCKLQILFPHASLIITSAISINTVGKYRQPQQNTNNYCRTHGC